MEQWASRNVDAGHPWGSGGRAVNSGDSLSFLGSEYNGRSASTDSKYYFADADTGAKAAEGDLDVKENGTVSKKYTFFTNTYGEIRYVVDAPGLPNSGGNERQGVLADDSVSEDINRRTHVVDKLRMAVEQSTGKDRAAGGTGMRSRTGVNWYNEAFDGITVIVQTTTIGAGYADPYERQTVLDPNLTTKSTGQGEMIKQSGDAYVLSAYKAKNYTQRYGKADMVGEFKGVEVYTESLDRLFWSRNFWIANSTTQDLH